MLEIKFMRSNLAAVAKAMASRGQTADLQSFSLLETERKTLLSEIESMRQQRNDVSEQVARLKKSGAPSESLVLGMREVSGRLKEMEKHLAEVEGQVHAIVMELPNIPHSSVPVGKDSSDNPVRRTVGTPPLFTFDGRPRSPARVFPFILAPVPGWSAR